MANRPKATLKANIASTSSGLGKTGAFSITPEEVTTLMDDMVDSAVKEPDNDGATNEVLLWGDNHDHTWGDIGEGNITDQLKEGLIERGSVRLRLTGQDLTLVYRDYLADPNNPSDPNQAANTVTLPTIAGQPGQDGNHGQDGTDGKDATVEVRYLRNNSSSAPNTPVGNNPAGWGTTALIPTTSARYVWRALRSGTAGALSAWMVTLASYLSEDGADGSPGASPQFVRLYTRSNSGTILPVAPPANGVPTSTWTVNYVAPTSTAGEEYAWVAIGYRVGTTGNYTYIVVNVAAHGSVSGGGTVPAPHTVYLLLMPEGTRTITASDVTGAPSDTIDSESPGTVNGSRREFTLTVPSPASWTTGKRAPFILIPRERTFEQLNVAGLGDQRSAFAVTGTNITINTVQYKYFPALNTSFEFRVGLKGDQYTLVVS